MGGYGSTRWAWYSPKPMVESSQAISMAKLRPSIQRAEGGLAMGSISWQPSGASVSFTLAGQLLTLSYRMRRGQADSWQERQEAISLEYTRPHYGGRRWWFTCPSCARRSAWLYLNSGRGRFVCRVCAGLVYRSQQEHDKTLDRYARYPDLAADLFGALGRAPGRASDAQLIQALKVSLMQERLSMRQRQRRGRRPSLG